MLKGKIDGQSFQANNTETGCKITAEVPALATFIEEMEGDVYDPLIAQTRHVKATAGEYETYLLISTLTAEGYEVEVDTNYLGTEENTNPGIVY